MLEYGPVSRRSDRAGREKSAIGRSRRAWDASDEALLAGLGTGDPASASVFVRRFQARVYGAAAAIVGDGPDAAEVAQEAFLRAWRHADAYDARRGSVATWILAITRNVSIDRIRMLKARPAEVFDVTSIATRPAVIASPEDAAVVSDEARRVEGVVAGLSHELRRALLLATVGGFTAQDVADREHIPLGTAKTRIRTALIVLAAMGYGATDPIRTVEAAMVTPSGRDVGDVRLLDGDPPWLLVSVPGWKRWDAEVGQPLDYRLQVEMADGTRLELRDVELSSSGDWGATADFDPSRVRRVVMTDSTGRVWCRADIQPPD